MIFVAVGSREYKFDRLIKHVDYLKKNHLITDEVFMQIGTSIYEPTSCDYVRFLNKDEFDKKIISADLLITHAGVGILMKAMKLHKKIIVVPRYAKYDEHIDDHQLEICKVFSENNILNTIAYDIRSIGEMVKYVKKSEFLFNNYRMKNLLLDYLSQNV